MKVFVSLFALLFASCKEHPITSNNKPIQTNQTRQYADSPSLGSKDSILSFENQGQREDYNAINFFREKYQKQHFERFDGKITMTGKTHFHYREQNFKVFCSSDLKDIFKKGILYPQLINGSVLPENKSKKEVEAMSPNKRAWYRMTHADSLTISDLEELKFLSVSPKVKRFRFLLFGTGIMNPSLYFFELTNNEATFNTNIDSFLNGATLTFFKEGGILI